MARQKKTKAERSHANAGELAGMPVAATLLDYEVRCANDRVSHASLAARAVDCGFPPEFLPRPLDSKVAFNRARKAGCVNLPSGFENPWQADLIDEECDDVQIVALLQEHDPEDKDDPDPWKGRMRVILIAEVRDEDGRILHPAMVFRQPLSRCTEEQASRATDVAIRIDSQFRRFRDYAAAQEVRGAAKEALKDAFVLQCRRSKWIAVGEHAITRSRSVGCWIDGVGKSDAATLPLFGIPEHMTFARKYASQAVHDEVEDLANRIAQTIASDGDDAGNASLRGLRGRMSELREAVARVNANASLLGEAADTFRRRLEDAEALLSQAGGDRELEQDIDAEATNGLRMALMAVRAAAQARNTETLRDAVAELRENESNARSTLLAKAWRRLRQQAATVDEGDDDGRFDGIVAATDSVARRASAADLFDDFDAI